MARPNGNTTGVSILATELDGKRQEILIEAIPGLRRMAILADFNSTAVEQLKELQNAARASNTELSIHRIAKGEEIPAAIEAAKSSGDTAINVLASPMLYSNRQIIFQRVAALHLPAIYQFAEMAEEGGLLAYGPRFTQIMRDIYARQLVQLFRGAKVTDIPVEQPTKFELVINLRTAKALSLSITVKFVPATRRQGDRIDMPFSAMRRSLMAHRVIRGAAPSLVPIGGIADIEPNRR